METSFPRGQLVSSTFSASKKNNSTTSQNVTSKFTEAITSEKLFSTSRVSTLSSGTGQKKSGKSSQKSNKTATADAFEPVGHEKHLIRRADELSFKVCMIYWK